MTLRDIITRALKRVGIYNVGETLEAEETQDAVNALNTMLDEWSADGLGGYCIVKESFSLTAGKGSYSYGTGGDFDSARPVRLLRAFLRDSANNDYPVDLISAAQYNGIPQKTDTGRPFCLYYNPTEPNGTVYVFYVPDTTGYTLWIDSEKALGSFSVLSANIVLPAEYLTAIEWNLGAELCPMFKRPVPLKVEQKAQKSLATLKRLNSSNKLRPIKMSQFPGPGTQGFWKSGDIRSGMPVV